MRPLNDKEFLNFKKYVKCGWLNCAFGFGLAGQGRCVHRGGKRNRKKCPEFITMADFLVQWKDRYENNPKERRNPETLPDLPGLDTPWDWG